jgi:hypothetical protein
MQECSLDRALIVGCMGKGLPCIYKLYILDPELPNAKDRLKPTITIVHIV